MKKHKKKSQLLLKPGYLALFIIALLGATLLVTSFASSSYVSVSPESGSITGRAVVCDAQPESQGQFVQFGSDNCNGQTYINPIKSIAADPGVIEVDGTYYMVWTTGEPLFYIFKSNDLINWEWSFANIFNNTHPWGVDRFWAPEIHKVGNKFVAYYSASTKSGKLAIGAATANSVTGPYTDIGEPLIEEPYGVIDVNFFSAPNGKNYLYWKEDGGNTRIFGQEVDNTGVNFIGQQKVVLQKSLAWEGDKGIEAPWVTFKDGRYYMFYSGELFSSDKYAIGVARSLSPLGQFVKKGDPIVSSSAVWKGPGHNSVVSKGGDDYLIYHAYKNNAGEGFRHTLLDKIIWQDNWPTINSGQPSNSPQQYP